MRKWVNVLLTTENAGRDGLETMTRKGNIECDAVHCVSATQDATCMPQLGQQPRRALHVQERKVLAAPGLVNDHIEDTLRWE